MELLGPFAIVMVCVLVVTAWLTRVAGYAAPETQTAPRRRVTDGPTIIRALPPLPPQRPAPLPRTRVRELLSLPDADRLLVADSQGRPPLSLQEHGGELWLAEASTGRLVGMGDAHLAALGIWSIWLRAVDSRTILAREGLLQPGSPLSLVRHPRNAQDSNAIAVYVSTGRLVGYVSPRIAAGLAAVLDAGMSLNAVALSFNPRADASGPGLIKVLAASPETLAHLFEPVHHPENVQMSPPDGAHVEQAEGTG